MLNKISQIRGKTKEIAEVLLQDELEEEIGVVAAIITNQVTNLLYRKN